MGANVYNELPVELRRAGNFYVFEKLLLLPQNNDSNRRAT